MPAVEPRRSAVFRTFLTSLEKIPRRISDRSFEDQRRIEAMAKFVQELAPWCVFATMTFKWSASVHSAAKCFEKFLRRNLPNVSCFYAIEVHPGGHGGHVHPLFDRDDFPRSAVWREWKQRYGRNRIEPIRGYDDVCSYVSKYVVKDHAWWNFTLSRAAWYRWRKEEIFLPPSIEKNFGGELSDLTLRQSSVSPKPCDPPPRAVGVPE